MWIGIAALVLGYVLSQFYRAFLAVLAPSLQAQLGTSPSELADASGIWFLTFAVMQLPVGFALDWLGPRRTAAVLHLVGAGGGAILFATAQGPIQLIWAMGLIGIGCAPSLMAAFYIFARLYSPAMFGTLGGLVIAVGSLGNLGATLPLSFAVEQFGWRLTLWGFGVASVLIAGAIWIFVKDPPKVETRATRGEIWAILRQPALWAILVMLLMHYVPAAALRGLWAGPYFGDIHAATAAQIGTATLIMAGAMVAGNFFYGPLDRVLGSRKWGVLGGNLAGLVLVGALWWNPVPSYGVAVALFAGIGFFGMSFPQLVAHGRAYFPPHLVGRGVTVLNLCAIGGVGVLQMVSGRLYEAMAVSLPSAQAFGVLFGFFTLVLGVGCLAYAVSQDRTD